MLAADDMLLSACRKMTFSGASTAWREVFFTPWTSDVTEVSGPAWAKEQVVMSSGRASWPRVRRSILGV